MTADGQPAVAIGAFEGVLLTLAPWDRLRAGDDRARRLALAEGSAWS